MLAASLVDVGRAVNTPSPDVLRRTVDATEQVAASSGDSTSGTLNGVVEEIDSDIICLESECYSSRCASQRVVFHTRGHCASK